MTATPGVPIARRSSTLSSSLGLGERLFASGDERKLADAIEAGLERVEERLLSEVRFADGLADTTTRYLLEAGGKRVRPVLVLLTSQLGDGVSEEIVRSATALEITHLASLYHDDVMDEAQMRRGVPSAQSVWGNSVAIITGDLLFARASTLLVGLGEEALRLQADTFERLCLGQLHETIGPRDGDDPVEHYLQVLADKTGSLIATAAESGVRFSNAPHEYIAPLRQFGEHVGVAFQLVDDVIDLSAETETTGKEAGTDLRAGVATLPLLYLREAAETDAASADLLARIERAVAGAGADADDAGHAAAERELADVVAQLREHPATARTLDDARRYAATAIAALAPLPDGPVKTAPTQFAGRGVDRDG